MVCVDGLASWGSLLQAPEVLLNQVCVVNAKARALIRKPDKEGG